MIVDGREARILSQLTKSTRFRNHTTSGGTYSTTRYDSRLQEVCPRRWPLAKISSTQSSLRWKGTERDGADDEQKRHVWWLPAVTMVYIATGPCLLLLLYYSTVSAAVRSCASPLFADLGNHSNLPDPQQQQRLTTSKSTKNALLVGQRRAPLPLWWRSTSLSQLSSASAPVAPFHSLTFNPVR